MAIDTSTRGRERNAQHWINVICGVLLFITPFVFGFDQQFTAARTAWAGGVIIFLMGVLALAVSAEWQEWVALIVGVLVIISPWVLGFAMVQAAAWSHLVLGLIVALAAISDLWAVHHSVATAVR